MDLLSHAGKFYHHLDAAKPFYIHCGKSRTPAVKFSSDSHYDLQLAIVLQGCEEIMYMNHRRSMGPGQVWFASCWEPHASRLTKANSKRIVITISPEFIGNATPFGELDWLAPFFAPPAMRPDICAPGLRKQVLRIGETIYRTYRRQPPARCRRSLIWLKIHELLLLLIENWRHPKCRQGSTPHLTNLKRIFPALERLKCHPESKYSLTEAAKDCGLSPSRFRYVFAETMGENFRQFVIKARISRASWLLRSTNEPIKNIAVNCGFADLQHFCHVFGCHFHCTPSHFRESHA